MKYITLNNQTSVIVSKYFVYEEVISGYTFMPGDFTRQGKTIKKMFASSNYFQSNMVPFGYTFLQDFLNITTLLYGMVTIHGRIL